MPQLGLHPSIPVVVVLGHRLLEPQQVQIAQLPGDPESSSGREAGVAVDEHVHLGPDGVADGPQAVDAAARRLDPVDRGRQAVEGGQLDGVVAVANRGRRVPGEGIRRPVPAGGPVDVGVDADLLPAGAPEQGVRRRPQRLAEQVPQGLLQAAEGAHARGLQLRGPEPLHELPNPPGIPPDEGVGHLPRQGQATPSAAPTGSARRDRSGRRRCGPARRSSPRAMPRGRCGTRRVRSACRSQ